MIKGIFRLAEIERMIEGWVVGNESRVDNIIVIMEKEQERWG